MQPTPHESDSSSQEVSIDTEPEPLSLALKGLSDAYIVATEAMTEAWSMLLDAERDRNPVLVEKSKEIIGASYEFIVARRDHFLDITRNTLPTSLQLTWLEAINDEISICNKLRNRLGL